MKCPKCKTEKTYVKEKRDRQDGTVYRRRRCKICGYRFSTTEQFAPEEETRERMYHAKHRNANVPILP